MAGMGGKQTLTSAAAQPLIHRTPEESMSVYTWSMKHASVILFFVAAVIFLISFGYSVLSINNGAETSIGSQLISAKLTSLLLFLSSTFTALSTAVIPFIGAVAIDRWDRQDSRDLR